MDFTAGSRHAASISFDIFPTDGTIWHLQPSSAAPACGAGRGSSSLWQVCRRIRLGGRAWQLGLHSMVVELSSTAGHGTESRTAPQAARGRGSACSQPVGVWPPSKAWHSDTSPQPFPAGAAATPPPCSQPHGTPPVHPHWGDVSGGGSGCGFSEPPVGLLLGGGSGHHSCSCC